MKLADVRKLAIRKQFKVRWVLRNGMECVVTEEGIAKLPAIDRIPDFNIEEEFAAAGDFLLDPVVSTDKKVDKKNLPKSRSVTRAELEGMASASPSAAPAPDHDDE